MRGTIASLLLVLGTVLGALAAANSAKASRSLALERDAYPGEHVARDVRVEPDDPESPLIAKSGTELTADVVAALRSSGRDEVEVKDPPVDVETLRLADSTAVEGRILAENVKLGEEDNQIEAGLRVTGRLLDRYAAAGLAELEVVIHGERRALSTAPAKPAGDLAPEASAAQAKRLAEQHAALLEEAEREGARVAETVTLHEDVLVKSGAFLDADLVDRLAAAGVTDVDVRIVKGFRVRHWEERYVYLAALVAMVLGVVLKRPRAAAGVDGAAADGGALGASDVRARVAALARKLEELAARVDGLAPDGIHAALDPLLADDVYTIVESRDAVAARLGAAGFVAVFGPFAAAERQMNRAWSAAVDGNVAEARECVHRAAEGMRATSAAFAGP
jgi:hypothetical protein